MPNHTHTMNEYTIIAAGTIISATVAMLAWLDGYNLGKMEERRRADKRIAGILDSEYQARVRRARK